METNEKWQREGTTIYKLHQIGWDKGKPLMSNKFYAQVYPDYRIGNAVELAEKEAKKMVASDDMLDVCEEVIRLKDLILPANVDHIREEHRDEIIALVRLVRQAEQAVRKATE